MTPLVIPPPPGLPTDEPWPPQATPVTPPPAPTPQPFPTPAFPKPAGQRPDQLQHLWFPYFPDSGSTPLLQAVLMDQHGQRWEQAQQSIDLGLQPKFPGPELLELYPSPDHQLLVANIAYGESIRSVIIDLSKGTSRSLPSGLHTRFLAWSPDGQRMIVEPPTFPLEVWVIDLNSQKYQTIDFPKNEFGYSLLRAAAYSPDGKWLADAIVYPATVSKPSWEIEIGIRAGEQNPRSPLFHLPDSSVVANFSLQWSPDGRKFLFVATAHGNDVISTQLWLINVADGTSKLLATLATDAPYNHPAVWSPDGRSIAAIKIGSDNRSGNVYLIDPETGQEQQLTRFTDRQISHLAWSPDGQILAFTVSGQDYGEIWVTSLDGARQHPVAGPTTPNAPFVWLSGR